MSPIQTYLGVEDRDTAFWEIVSPSSASGLRDSGVSSSNQQVRYMASEIRHFDRNHLKISKPAGTNDKVDVLVEEILNNEFLRLAAWDQRVSHQEPEYRLCTMIPFHPESED